MDLDRFKRWMNLRVLYLKAVLPVSFPLILNIEPTNRCNLACQICPREQSGRPLADLAWQDFEILLRELADNGPILKIFLQKDGEPLLYPRLTEMVAHLVERRAARNISIITNGTLLDGRRFRELAQAGLNDLIISIDATNPAEFLALKGRDLYDQVVENLERAIRIKQDERLTGIRLKPRLVARRGHEATVAAFRKRWEGRVDMVDITPYHTWLGAVADERCYASGKRYPCPLLWYTGVVNADGNVSPCCIDYRCGHILGRIRPDGFKAVWNGRALGLLRRRHLLGEYDRTPICGPCEYWLIKEDLGTWLRRKYRVPGGDDHG